MPDGTAQKHSWGGCRMGRDPGRPSSTPTAEARRPESLRGGCSVFPSASEKNPTHTSWRWQFAPPSISENDFVEVICDENAPRGPEMLGAIGVRARFLSGETRLYASTWQPSFGAGGTDCPLCAGVLHGGRYAALSRADRRDSSRRPTTRGASAAGVR